MVNLLKTSTVSSEKIFCWQEKVEKNTDYTTSPESSKTDVLISLFSYIDADMISMGRKNKKSYTHPTSQLSQLEEKLGKLKPKTILPFHEVNTWQKPLFSSAKNIVKIRNIKNETFAVGQSMVIMAALYFEDSSSVEEIELCYLQLSDYGTLTVIPDFSRKKSYSFIDSRSETFEYEIEHVSQTPKDSTILREENLLKKMALHKRKLKENLLMNDFVKPPLQSIYMLLNCEIVSAMDFGSSDIFVHYLIVPPEGWKSDSVLEGVTETCRCKWKDHAPVAYYGYTFSIDLSAEVKENISKSAKIIVEVTAVDMWGNFRNEGYGYSDVMLIPGMTTLTVHTWRIEPKTLRDKLQNFFIGGMPHLEDLSYIASPEDFKESQLSKYGVRTVTSGIIKLKSCILEQRNTENIKSDR